jgi:hypothetical protein
MQFATLPASDQANDQDMSGKKKYAGDLFSLIWQSFATRTASGPMADRQSIHRSGPVADARGPHHKGFATVQRISPSSTLIHWTSIAYPQNDIHPRRKT